MDIMSRQHKGTGKKENYKIKTELWPHYEKCKNLVAFTKENNQLFSQIFT